MPMIRWNPWNIDRLLEEDWDIPTIPGLSRLVGQGLNLYETEKELVAEAALPGIPEKNIDITIDEGVVRVVGNMSQEEKDKSKQRSFLATLSSTYNYSFRLPQGVVTDQEPNCELTDGVLTMRFAKVQKAPPKKLAIKKSASAGKEEKT